MDYERIHKVQTGVISPSKLRLKLLGAHHHRRKEGGNGSSRTSPSKLEDAEYAKDSLLAAKNGVFDEEGNSNNLKGASMLEVVLPNLGASTVKLSLEGVANSGQGNQTHPRDIPSKEISDTGCVKIQNFPKSIAFQSHSSSNSSTVHPVRSLEESYIDCDSGNDNASVSSFEFHKGERTLHSPVLGPFSRPLPSKWNDAEKWIVNRQASHSNHFRKTVLQQSQANRQPVMNWVRSASESVVADQRASVCQVADTKPIDSCHPTSQVGLEKFSFVPSGDIAILRPVNGTIGVVDQCLNSDLKEMNQKELSLLEKLAADARATPAVRSVSMRDMGTEMTPVTSQEPSRTGTPAGSTTPIRSPTSSIPSTPRRGATPVTSPVEATTDEELDRREEPNKKELSERELQLKTRREIVALGVQLGKMNIAAWASKDEKEDAPASLEAIDAEQLEKTEFDTRAAAWEEAENYKHTARYKREEIRIQAWESCQKAKIEAKMRRIEAQVEQVKARAQEKMLNKLAIMRQKSEEKRSTAEAQRNRQAEKTAEQAEYIRQTGHIPSSHYGCCIWFS